MLSKKFLILLLLISNFLCDKYENNSRKKNKELIIEQDFKAQVFYRLGNK